MRFLKLSLVCLSFLSIQLIYAESKETVPDGPAAAPLPKDQKEFIDKKSKLNTLINRIAESEKQFKSLVQNKSLAKTAIDKQKIIHEMLELANQRNKDVDAYNKLKSELALRYPNEGEHLNRRYQTQTKRSIEELEGVAGLDEMLTRTKKVVEKKFAPFMENEPQAATGKKQLAQQPGAEDEPKRLRLEK